MSNLNFWEALSLGIGFPYQIGGYPLAVATVVFLGIFAGSIRRKYSKKKKTEKLIDDDPLVRIVLAAIPNMVFCFIALANKPYVKLTELVQVASFWPIFLTSLYMTNMLLRDFAHRLKFPKWMRKCLRAINPFRWKSPWAKRIALHIAKMENEPGLFQEEIAKIGAAAFPADIVFGLWYLRRAKKVRKSLSLGSEERENLESIYRAVRRMSGKIITQVPQGGEDALALTMALREKAEGIVRNHAKSQTSYTAARAELLLVIRDLRAVQDVVGAGRDRTDLSHYSLLGITREEAAEDPDLVQRAYRKVSSAVHPDVNGSNVHLGRLQAIVNEAYRRLRTPAARQAYDLEIG